MLAYLHEHSLLDPVQFRSKTANRVRQVLYQLASQLAIYLISRTLVGTSTSCSIELLRSAAIHLVFIGHSQMEYLSVLLLK